MEKAILVNLAINKREKTEAEESMEELAGLAHAAGAQVVKKIFQNRPSISPRYFIGQGKVEEIKQIKGELDADLVIFDHNLSPIQQRSLEDELQVKVIDRTQLILDIFAQRARSNEGKLQVELAQLSYLLPRLVGKGIALSRLGAGIGTRGPGEKKLEEDRRRIADRISRIKKEIEAVGKRRASQRESRKKGPVPNVSLVGYTSAGKTTLFNLLSQERMFTSPQLFATLDPVLRRVTLAGGAYFFLSDTVGFIKKLPVELITSFKATLEEVREADCICHVIDITSPYSMSHEEAVGAILAEIGVRDVPILKVYNKIDLLAEKRDLLARNASSTQGHSFYISAKSGEGVDDLRERLLAILFRDLKIFFLHIPKAEDEAVRSLSKWSLVLKKRENGDYLDMKIMAHAQAMAHYAAYLSEGEENW